MSGDLAPRTLPACSDFRSDDSLRAAEPPTAETDPTIGPFAGFVIAATNHFSGGTAEAGELTIRRERWACDLVRHELQFVFGIHGVIYVPCALHLSVLNPPRMPAPEQPDGWYVVLEEWVTNRGRRRAIVSPRTFTPPRASVPIVPLNCSMPSATCGGTTPC